MKISFKKEAVPQTGLVKVKPICINPNPAKREELGLRPIEKYETKDGNPTINVVLEQVGNVPYYFEVTFYPKDEFITTKESNKVVVMNQSGKVKYVPSVEGVIGSPEYMKILKESIEEENTTFKEEYKKFDVSKPIVLLKNGYLPMVQLLLAIVNASNDVDLEITSFEIFQKNYNQYFNDCMEAARQSGVFEDGEPFIYVVVGKKVTSNGGVYPDVYTKSLFGNSFVSYKGVVSKRLMTDLEGWSSFVGLEVKQLDRNSNSTTVSTSVEESAEDFFNA